VENPWNCVHSSEFLLSFIRISKEAWWEWSRRSQSSQVDQVSNVLEDKDRGHICIDLDQQLSSGSNSDVSNDKNQIDKGPNISFCHNRKHQEELDARF